MNISTLIVIVMFLFVGGILVISLLPYLGISVNQSIFLFTNFISISLFTLYAYYNSTVYAETSILVHNPMHTEFPVDDEADVGSEPNQDPDNKVLSVKATPIGSLMMHDTLGPEPNKPLDHKKPQASDEARKQALIFQSKSPELRNNENTAERINQDLALNQLHFSMDPDMPLNNKSQPSDKPNENIDPDDLDAQNAAAQARLNTL